MYSIFSSLQNVLPIRITYFSDSNGSVDITLGFPVLRNMVLWTGSENKWLRILLLAGLFIRDFE